MPLEDLKREVIRERNAQAVQLFTTVPNYKQLAFGWRVSTALSISPLKTMFFGWDEMLSSFEMTWISEFLREFTALCKVGYGIGYQRPFAQGPDLYAYGMSTGLSYAGMDREESNRISLWIRERMQRRRYRTSMLRDVYRLNVLTEEHLQAKVGYVSLRAWISSTAERGVLQSISAETYLWHVPQETLQAVQTALTQAGLLICR